MSQLVKAVQRMECGLICSSAALHDIGAQSYILAGCICPGQALCHKFYQGQ